jgi:hypothetical protein
MSSGDSGPGGGARGQELTGDKEGSIRAPISAAEPHLELQALTIASLELNP